MPYKFKGKKSCTQSDGSKGQFLTIKKDGSRRCYKSKKQYNSAQSWAHESDNLEEKEGENVVTEKKLREMIKNQLISSLSEAKKVLQLNEQEEDKDLNLDELEGLQLPPVLKKLLDPNISPSKYADIDQTVDASGNINQQGFAIAAFILSYADMDEGTANQILNKAKAILPKIVKAREANKAKASETTE